MKTYVIIRMHQKCPRLLSTISSIPPYKKLRKNIKKYPRSKVKGQRDVEGGMCF